MNTPNLIQQAYTHFQNGEIAYAEQALQHILKTQPNNIDALHVLGVIYAATQQNSAAASYFQKALALDNNNVALHYKLARVQSELGQFSAALHAYDTIIALGYLKPEVLLAQSVAMAQLQRYPEAVEKIEQVLTQWPAYPEAWSHKALMLYQLRQFEAALVCFEHARSLQPEKAEHYYHTSLAFDKLARYPEALCNLDQAIRIAPKTAIYWYDRAIVLYQLGRYSEALQNNQAGLALMPTHPAAWADQGLILSRMQQHEPALVSYNRALALRCDDPDVQSNQSLSQLALGQFEVGWQNYEYRWQKGNADIKRHTAIPLWLGKETLKGKRILLWAEQGLGDTIQFCRYVTLVAQLGAEIVLEVDLSLKAIAQTMGNFQVIALGEDFDPVHYQTPLMSLPLALHTSADNIPADVPYFQINQEKKQYWKIQLAHSVHKLKIGLACSGNPGNTNDKRRSIALQEFAPLLTCDTVDFFLIQPEIRASDDAFLQQHPQLKLGAEKLAGFDDTAALLANLDLVISVDTSIAHLTGALGIPVWILLPWAPDWRWLLDRQDNPWYPSVTLFRQDSTGNWGHVLQRLRASLQAMLSSLHSHSRARQ